MKDKTYTPEEIQKKFDSLPPDVKDLVYGADMLSVIQKVGERYKLHIDQLTTLEAETADVLTGFSKPEEFVANLVASLSVDRTQAESIAKEINDSLFIKIRESMKKVYEQSKEGPGATSNVQPVPAPKPAQPVAPATPVTPVAPKSPAVMPSASSVQNSLNAPKSPASSVPPSIPTAKPATPSAPPMPPALNSMQKVPAIRPADITLSQKTVSAPKPPAPVSVPAPSATSTQTPSSAGSTSSLQANSGQAKPTVPPKPGGYTADPYREPIE